MLVRAQIAISEDRLVFGSGDVASLAHHLVARGAHALQLRDVDGALLRTRDWPGWLEQLLSGQVPVQLDASLEDSQLLDRAAAAGFDSIVVGMHALFEPLLLRWALDLVGHRLVVELNVDGDYLFDPPAGGFALPLHDAVRRLHSHGVRHVLLRDVTATEIALPRLQEACAGLDVQVTYSGPVRSVDDVRKLALLDPRCLRAVVIGAPLYDGRIDIGEATRIAGRSR